MITRTRKRQPYEVTYWKDRVAGPTASTFPLSKGWKIGDEVVTLGNIKISETTRILKCRKFRKPAAEDAWLQRFGYPIMVAEMWKARSYMLTPRDRMTFWKVRHRTLYTRKHDKETDGKCAACTEYENIEHLVDCSIIKIEFWDRIMELLEYFEFDPPSDRRALLLLGMTSPVEVAHPEVIGVHVAWRALYAELTRAHVDKVTPDLDRAYKRMSALTHTRLVAFGQKWKIWVLKRIHTSRPSIVPVPLQDGNSFIKIDMLQSLQMILRQLLVFASL